jgi:transcriptional regulator with XRE-family HTH domain
MAPGRAPGHTGRVDRAQLADFLRTRREALQPEDVGLPRGQRRRTGGLRREEVAALCQMSADYYARIEQQRGTRPSEQMLAAIDRALHLSLDERDHLFRLAGHGTPQRTLRSEHVSPGLMRILDRLDDTPAQVVTELGETLMQTRQASASDSDRQPTSGPVTAANRLSGQVGLRVRARRCRVRHSTRHLDRYRLIVIMRWGQALGADSR